MLNVLRRNCWIECNGLESDGLDCKPSVVAGKNTGVQH